MKLFVHDILTQWLGSFDEVALPYMNASTARERPPKNQCCQKWGFSPKVAIFRLGWDLKKNLQVEFLKSVDKCYIYQTYVFIKFLFGLWRISLIFVCIWGQQIQYCQKWGFSPKVVIFRLRLGFFFKIVVIFHPRVGIFTQKFLVTLLFLKVSSSHGIKFSYKWNRL